MTTSNRGELHGPCNRSACHRTGALYFNTSTRAYYCLDCARSINTWSIRDERFPICFLTGSAGADDTLMKFGQTYGND